MIPPLATSGHTVAWKISSSATSHSVLQAARQDGKDRQSEVHITVPHPSKLLPTRLICDVLYVLIPVYRCKAVGQR